jgi:hypothetical protein
VPLHLPSKCSSKSRQHVGWHSTPSELPQWGLAPPHSNSTLASSSAHFLCRVESLPSDLTVMVIDFCDFYSNLQPCNNSWCSVQGCVVRVTAIVGAVWEGVLQGSQQQLSVAIQVLTSACKPMSLWTTDPCDQLLMVTDQSWSVYDWLWLIIQRLVMTDPWLVMYQPSQVPQKLETLMIGHGHNHS